jgi:hypothetical protein
MTVNAATVKDLLTGISWLCAGCGLLGRERITRLDQWIRERIAAIPATGKKVVRTLRLVLTLALAIIPVIALAIPPMVAIGGLFPGGRSGMFFFGDDNLYATIVRAGCSSSSSPSRSPSVC